MRTKLRILLAAVSVMSGLAVVSVFAQTGGDTMSSSKVSHQQMMDKMDKMTPAEKAAMFDKMSDKDRMSAMKMAGHDTSKMSSSQRMDMMGKMSTDDKASMFDKMPMEKKMSMMKDGKMKDSKKMDKDKMNN